MLLSGSFRRFFISSLVLFFTFCLYRYPKYSNYIIEENKVSNNKMFLIDENNYVSLVEVTCKSYNDVVRDVFEGLINPECLPIGFKSYINNGTRLLDYSINDKILKLNFSEDFLDVEVGFEEQMLEMVVYSFTSISNIDGIMIFVNGNILDKLPNSHKRLPTLLDKNFGINKVVDLTTFNDSVSFVVYYLSKNVDYYYVPITYVMNKDEDVAQMIVKKLKSNSLGSSLLTHIDDSIEMVDYNLDGNSMELVFNNDLKNIMFDGVMDEEVRYILTASFKDSFDVDEVEISFIS